LRNFIKKTAGLLPSQQTIAYSAPVLITYWLLTPVSLIQGIYAKYYGLPLTAIAAVVFAARLFDAISDPVIGVCSDRYHARGGSRKPFVLCGALLFIVSAYYFYAPGDTVTVRYFCIWFILLFLSYTLFEVPHLTWGSELSDKPQQRTQLFSTRAAAGYCGLIIFYSIPLLPFFETKDITPETLKYSVTAAGLLMLPAIFYCIKNVPDGERVIKAAPPKIVRPPLKQRLQPILQNRAYLLFLGFVLFAGICMGMWYALIFLYVDTYLLKGELFAQMFLLSFIIGLVSTPLWSFLALRYNTKVALAVGMILLAISCFATGLLTPESSHFLALLLVKSLNTLGFYSFLVLAPVLLATIIDHTQQRFGVDQRATFYALFTFSQKSNLAIGTAISLAIAGVYGFDASQTVHSENSLFGLRLAIVWLPPVFMALALWLLFLIPLAKTGGHSSLPVAADGSGNDLASLNKV